MRIVQMNPFTAPAASPPRHNTLSPPPPPKDPQRLRIDISGFKKDDWILLGIIAALILEGSTDYVLICALGYLFLMGL